MLDVTEAWQPRLELPGRGSGIVAGQVDDKLGIDVYVANNMSPNHLWCFDRDPSNRDGSSRQVQPREVASMVGVATDGESRSQGSMGIAVADFNHDWRPDLYVTNFVHEYNVMYMSRLPSGWVDQTTAELIATPTVPLVGFGAQAVDLDLNGDQEIIVTNGHVDHFSDDQGRSTYSQPMILFQRQTNGKLIEVHDRIASPYFKRPHVGRALWTIDADRDGRTDLAVTHQTEPVALLLNRTEVSGRCLQLSLVGVSGARTAVGSVARVSSGQDQQVAFLNSGDGFLCSNQRMLSFAVPRDAATFELTVRWSDGIEQTWNELACDKHWLVVQNEEPFALE